MSRSAELPRHLVLGRYRVLEQIAAGATARVYRARDEQLRRDVAVKLLHPHLLPDVIARRRLEAEARAAAGLSHPAIATVYDVDVETDAPAIVMELVDGESLAARLASERRLTAADAARIGADVADALYHAHRRGIVHRDVKPGNILLERHTGRARLIDFGISHSLAPGAESLTQTGTSLGTPRYMSPEQMAGTAPGPRTDLWSLGAVLYQALAGRAPFHGSTPLAIARQHSTGPPPLPGDIDRGLAAIVRSLLAYRVEDRPIHAGAVAQALRSWRPVEGEATTLTSIGASIAVAASGASAGGDETSPAVVPASHEPGAPGRSRRLPVLAAAVLAGVALLAAAFVIGRTHFAAEAPSAAPAPATATPTPAWVGSLQAAHLEACGEPLESDELDGRTRQEAQVRVAELVEDCLEERDEDEGPPDDGRGNGDEGNGGPPDDRGPPGGRGNGDEGNGGPPGDGRGNGGGE